MRGGAAFGAPAYDALKGVRVCVDEAGQEGTTREAHDARGVREAFYITGEMRDASRAVCDDRKAAFKSPVARVEQIGQPRRRCGINFRQHASN
jgi:hypothetical protein